MKYVKTFESVNEDLRPDEVEYLAKEIANHKQWDNWEPTDKEVMDVIKKDKPFGKPLLKNASSSQKKEAIKIIQDYLAESVNEGKLTEDQEYRLKSALKDVRSKGGPSYRKAVMIVLELAKKVSGENPKNIKHALKLLDHVEEVYTQVPGKMIAFDIGDDDDDEKKNDMIKKKKMKGPMGTVGYLGVAEDDDEEEESETEKTRKREGRVPGPEGGVGYAGKERG
jgi:hypothetical protein